MKESRFSYQEGAGIDASLLKKEVKKLEGYREYLVGVVAEGGYEAPEASLNLLDDDYLSHRIECLSGQIAGEDLKYIIVCGIGGSSLGAKAVYEAMYGTRDMLLPRMPKLVFIETVSGEGFSKVQALVDTLSSKREVIVLVISKSGSTTETIVNFEVIAEMLTKKFGDISDRFVAITDENSRLDLAADERSIERLFIPKNVGGRYSVFSAVALLPLRLAGVDTSGLRAGAQAMLTRCLSGDHLENPAMVSAALIALHYKAGKGIHNSFFFSPRLESVGKWYRQLMGESIGKRLNLEGDEVHTGIVPIVSIGSTDLHSMAQLYFGGPRSIFTTLVEVEEAKERYRVPHHPFLGELVEGTAGKEAHEILEALYEGMKTAYQESDVPYVQMTLPTVTAFSIGEYLQWKMIETMYLARLLNVNAFDQPDVEGYKEETRKNLEE